MMHKGKEDLRVKLLRRNTRPRERQAACNQLESRSTLTRDRERSSKISGDEGCEKVCKETEKRRSKLPGREAVMGASKVYTEKQENAAKEQVTEESPTETILQLRRQIYNLEHRRKLKVDENRKLKNTVGILRKRAKKAKERMLRQAKVIGEANKRNEAERSRNQSVLTWKNDIIQRLGQRAQVLERQMRKTKRIVDAAKEVCKGDQNPGDSLDMLRKAIEEEDEDKEVGPI